MIRTRSAVTTHKNLFTFDFIYSQTFFSLYFLWQKMVLLLRESSVNLWIAELSAQMKTDVTILIFFYFNYTKEVRWRNQFILWMLKNGRWCCNETLLEWHFIVILYVSKSMNEINKLFDMLTFSPARLCRHNKGLFANLPQRIMISGSLFRHFHKN